jgi:glucose-6-phosphate 1-dehydrogenase
MSFSDLEVKKNNDEATAAPTILVIFGGTGNLMAKKVLPALFHLHQKNKLPRLFKAVGIARRRLSDEGFRSHIAKALEKHEDLNVTGDGPDLERFLSLFSYHKGSVRNRKDYERLAVKLGMIDGEWKTCSNKLFYIGILPNLYEPTLKNLAASGLTKPCSEEEGWTRIIIEKPFGGDLKSAKRLCKLLCSQFRMEQLYLIDHYLGKEMIQNILFFRFANNFLEAFWNNKYIDRIEARLLEDIGVEGRGAFYDSVGALRDVGQNHMLQMLALAIMDNPVKFEPSTIRTNRARILESLREFTADEAQQFTFRAQHEGYRKIDGVGPDSVTETYFKIVAFLDSPRWQGVPVIFEAGKRLEKPRKEIVLRFRHPTFCLCPPESESHQESRIVFSLEPKETVQMHLQSKEPGFKPYVGGRSLSCVFREEPKRAQYVEEYERLLFDCIVGDQTFFVSIEEVEASWRFIDPIVASWKKGQPALKIYEPHRNMILSDSKIVEQQISKKAEIKKELGIVGLGKMGSNLALSLVEKGWKVAAYNRTYEVTRNLTEYGVIGTASLREFVDRLPPPRVVWLMVKAGNPVDDLLFGAEGLARYLTEGDTVIDGGNSFYKESVRRAKKLARKRIDFVDVGVSGGPEGARHGACLMVGGKKESYEKLFPLFLDIAMPQGVQFFEGVGAGHFVKMVHNGIEYGIMQAMGEGFTVLKNAKYSLNLRDVADVFNHGSVIESRLTGWLKEAFEVHGVDLKNVSGTIGHTGEGEWTVKVAEELGVKAKIIEESLKFRMESEKNPSYTGRILSALREQFGGHSVTIENNNPNC